MKSAQDKNQELPFTTAIHRQHSSLVTTVPKKICRMMNIEAGDLACFNYNYSSKMCTFNIILKKDGSHVENGNG